MKVGVFLTDLPPAAGGGFSYIEKLIQGIDHHSFDQQLEICFVGRLPHEKIKLRRAYIPLSAPSYFRVFDLLGKIGITPLLTRIFKRNANLCNRNDIAILRKHDVDVVFYAKQSFNEIENFPFISMNWDIGHKSTFAFPELTGKDHFQFRETWYSVSLQKAFAVFVESEHGKRELSKYFSIPELKISVVPLFPGNVVDMKVDEASQQAILKKHQLEEGKYFYYPAQYWAHKNHYNLITAFKKLSDQRPSLNLKLVFTGSDQGNKAYVQAVVKSLSLDPQVLMLGFVDKEEVFTFYKKSISLVMPTFLGPTNMPLLEAQALDVPVICSDFEGHREICGDGALYVDPSNASEILAAMQSMLQPRERDGILQKGKEVYGKTIFTLANALVAINDALVKLRPIRKTFL